jgi:hypothetical protein
MGHSLPGLPVDQPADRPTGQGAAQ